MKGLKCSNKKVDGEYIKDKNGKFNFVDESGEIKYFITLPFFRDNENNRYRNIDHSLKEINGQLIYTKKPTKKGEDDLVYAKYPILIDSTNYTGTTADGYIRLSENGSTAQEAWDSTHDGATGDTSDDTTSPASAPIESYCNYAPAKGDPSAIIMRSFLYIDTSGIPDTATVTAADLRVYGYGSADSSVSAQIGTQADNLSTADFDAFSGDMFGVFNGGGGWDDSSWNFCDLDGTSDCPSGKTCDSGLSHVNKTDVTKICLREYTYDYLDTLPPDS